MWAAFQPLVNAVFLDTEGFSGNSGNLNSRKRLLLKVMSLSDVVIYKTRSERLSDEVLQNLADASEAHYRFFANKIGGGGPLPGPSVVICHETQFSDVLPGRDADGVSPEEHIADRMDHNRQDRTSLRRISYVGARLGGGASAAAGKSSSSSGEEDEEATERASHLGRLRERVERDLQDAAPDGRGARSLDKIFEELTVLWKSFSDPLERSPVSSSFSSEHLACTARCQVCQRRCGLPRDHSPSTPHSRPGDHRECVYDEARDNRRFFCRRCRVSGGGGRDRHMVFKSSASSDSTFGAMISYATSGSVLVHQFPQNILLSSFLKCKFWNSPGMP